MAAQLLAAHNAAMECYRRAMHSEQTFEGRRENLNQANKLSRSSAVLLEALNRHRGKGQQKVTVEHVTVNAGGQAIVGAVATPGEGWRANLGWATPCTYPCTWHPDAEPGRDARTLAVRRRCLTAAVVCTGGALTLVRRPARGAQSPPRQGAAKGHG